jgi:DNA-binding IclR family transcriptional regulator
MRKLHAQLKRIREQGYLLMHDVPLSVVTIACPVFTQHGDFWGVIGSYAPHFRMNKARQRQWLEHLRSVSKNPI